jgi:hypothetical protein
MKSSLPVKL